MSTRFRLSYQGAIERLIQHYQPPPVPSVPVIKQEPKEKVKSAKAEQDDSDAIENSVDVFPDDKSTASSSKSKDCNNNVKSAVCMGEGCKKRSQLDCIHK
jgi:hypothetical protein